MSGSGQRGSASVWTLVVVGGAFTALLGLVVDGGRALDARAAAAAIAAQAARDAADSLSSAKVRDGEDAIDMADANRRLHADLVDTGLSGTIHLRGQAVEVTVVGTVRTEFLAAIGVATLSVKESRTAIAITEEQRR